MGHVMRERNIRHPRWQTEQMKVFKLEEFFPMAQRQILTTYHIQHPTGEPLREPKLKPELSAPHLVPLRGRPQALVGV